eukprot:COSAG04_NODE_15342_length_535_cov_0.788991_1_plen_174_part_10
MSTLGELAFAGEEDALRQRIAAGASPNDPAELFGAGCPPLFAAADQGHVNVVRVLVEAGASLEATTPKGSTALLIAAQNGHADCVEALLQGGANVHAKGSMGQTALHPAAENGHTDCCRLLILAGADSAVTAVGKTPLQWAYSERHAEVVDLLRADPRACGAADMAMPAGTRLR